MEPKETERALPSRYNYPLVPVVKLARQLPLHAATARLDPRAFYLLPTTSRTSGQSKLLHCKALYGASGEEGAYAFEDRLDTRSRALGDAGSIVPVREDVSDWRSGGAPGIGVGWFVEG